jgi:hypothetical protein
MKQEGKYEVIPSRHGHVIPWRRAHSPQSYAVASFHGAVHIPRNRTQWRHSMAPCTFPAIVRSGVIPWRRAHSPQSYAVASFHGAVHKYLRVLYVPFAIIENPFYSVAVSITNDAPGMATRCVSAPVCGSSSYNPSALGCSRQ